MKKYIKTNLTKIKQGISLLLCLSGMLLASCKCDKSPTPPNEILKEESNQSNNPVNLADIVLFCGNPGSGKSALCNSIFQKTIFQSGPSLGKGMTKEKEEHTHEGIKYIDTPGLSDVVMREKAAKEIEEALKQNGKYKIVFVATLEGGRIKRDDLVTINTVCDAITTEFSYGIIFNKVTKTIENLINKDENKDERMAVYLSSLHKAPLDYIFIEKEKNMEDKPNTHFGAESENRVKLLEFIAKLKPNVILASNVTTINVNDYQKTLDELAVKLNEAMKTIDEQAEAIKKAKKKIAEESKK